MRKAVDADFHPAVSAGSSLKYRQLSRTSGLRPRRYDLRMLSTQTRPLAAATLNDCFRQKPPCCYRDRRSATLMTDAWWEAECPKSASRSSQARLYSAVAEGGTGMVLRGSLCRCDAANSRVRQ